MTDLVDHIGRILIIQHMYETAAYWKLDVLMKEDLSVLYNLVIFQIDDGRAGYRAESKNIQINGPLLDWYSGGVSLPGKGVENRIFMLRPQKEDLIAGNGLAFSNGEGIKFLDQKFGPQDTGFNCIFHKRLCQEGYDIVAEGFRHKLLMSGDKGYKGRGVGSFQSRLHVNAIGTLHFDIQKQKMQLGQILTF